MQQSMLSWLGVLAILSNANGFKLKDREDTGDPLMNKALDLKRYHELQTEMKKWEKEHAQLEIQQPNTSWKKNLDGSQTNYFGYSLTGKHAPGQDSSCIGAAVQKHVRQESSNAEEMLAEGSAFTFLHIGDNDINCINGLPSANLEEDMRYDKASCDELSDATIDIGTRGNSNVILVLGTFLLCENQNRRAAINRFLEHHAVNPSFKGFVTSGPEDYYLDLIGNSYISVVAPPVEPEIFPYLATRKVVAVGRQHLTKLQYTLNLAGFIDVSGYSRRIGELVNRMKEYSAKWKNDNVLFLVSGGVPGRVAMYRCWVLLGQKDTFIDVGDSLDGFAGFELGDFNHTQKLCGTLPQFMAPGLCHYNETLDDDPDVTVV